MKSINNMHNINIHNNHNIHDISNKDSNSQRSTLRVKENLSGSLFNNQVKGSNFKPITRITNCESCRNKELEKRIAKFQPNNRNGSVLLLN